MPCLRPTPGFSAQHRINNAMSWKVILYSALWIAVRRSTCWLSYIRNQVAFTTWNPEPDVTQCELKTELSLQRCAVNIDQHLCKSVRHRYYCCSAHNEYMKKFQNLVTVTIHFRFLFLNSKKWLNMVTFFFFTCFSSGWGKCPETNVKDVQWFYIQEKVKTFNCWYFMDYHF